MMISSDLTSYILILQFGICFCQQALKYNVKEETEPGFVLGNINEYVTNNYYEIGKYDVQILNKYFDILPNKDVVVKKRIDLETFCNENNICGTSGQCIVNISVRITTGTNIDHRFNIYIEIFDINDNLPTFKSPVQSVTIEENSKIGTQIALDGGSDLDVTQTNQIQSYKLEESTKTFELDSNDISSLYLLLHKLIDYERQSVYHAKLYACDNVTRCVVQQIIINIQDVNDNYPFFEKKSYYVEILETVKVGKVIVQPRAIDKDGPQFNKTKYGFHNNRDLTLVAKLDVNPRNGNIAVKSKLTAKQYKFTIYAMDVLMSGRKDTADVIINVKDENDNKPVIEAFKSKTLIDDKDTYEIKIAENEPPQKLISMRVTDSDLGENAKVSCELKDPSSSLELKVFEPDTFEIFSVKSFDYEQEKEIKAMFECRDKGIKPLSSYKSIKVIIEDVNEHQPEFQHNDYYVNLKENSPPGQELQLVRATDKDGSAVLRYSLEEAVSNYFEINPNTGQIKTGYKSFDREKIASKSFRVTVTDAIVNPKSSETQVQVTIVDENDNSPIFSPRSPQLFISENQPLQSKLQGKLFAKDEDQDSSNSRISFSLVDTYDSDLKKCERPYFRIDVNGEIETLSELDREQNANFTLTIEAKDHGSPPRYTRTNATVVVRDVNDNAPYWIYPRQPDTRKPNFNSMPMLNLTENTERFMLIMKLKANDPDQNEAGRVSYVLVNHHDSLFSLNDTTGELRTDKSPLPYGQYQLQLRAMDHGNPARNSDSWMLINVFDSGKLANINLTIIIGMVAITALISIFLIVAIICVRRRPRLHQNYLAPSSDGIKESSNHYFSPNQWIYQPTDENIMPPLSDNDSRVYLPASYYESQEHPAFQSQGGSRPASRLEYPLILPSSNHPNNMDHKIFPQTSQNIERASGTFRTNNGQYCSMNIPSSGIIINGQELDGDSADSGKGASEVDLRLQHHLNNASRNYPTMPFPNQSTASSSFGYQPNLPGQQFYSINSKARVFDSRFLTLYAPNSSHNRRAMSPTFNSNNQCQCFMLPEDEVVQTGLDSNQIPMTTFSPQSMCNLKSVKHDQNCVYRDNILSPSGVGYYANCPYIQGSVSPIPFNVKDNVVNDLEIVDDKGENDKYESYNNVFEGIKKPTYSSSEQLNQEKSVYTLGLAN